MEKKVDFNIKPELEKWVLETFPENKFEHASAYVELRDQTNKAFSQGILTSREDHSILLVRGEGRTHDGIIYFGGTGVSAGYSLRNLQEALSDVARDLLPLKLEKSPVKGFQDSTEVHTPDLEYEVWRMDEDIVDDLCTSSSIDGGPRLTSASNLESRWSVFVNTSGAHILQPLHSLILSFAAKIDAESPLYRTVGFSPKRVADLKKIYDLFGHVTDINIEGKLSGCKDSQDIMTGLRDIGIGVLNAEEKISSGRYTIVTPSLTHTHEFAGHACESNLIKPRKHLMQGPYVEEDMFPEGLDLESPGFNLTDNPHAQLEGLDLVATYKFDKEGIRTRPKELIRRGIVLPQKLGSRYSEGNDIGNAECYAGIAIAQPRMSVTDTAPTPDGPRSIAELCETTNRPTIVCLKDVGWVDSQHGMFQLGSNLYDGDGGNPEAYLVVKGKAYPIKNPFLIAGSCYMPLENAVMGNKELVTTTTGACGKGNPTMSEDVWDHTPSTQVGPLAALPLVGVRTFRRRNGDIP